MSQSKLKRDGEITVGGPKQAAANYQQGLVLKKRHKKYHPGDRWLEREVNQSYGKSKS